MSSANGHKAPLDEVRRRRAELRKAMGRLEDAVTAPVSGDWILEVRDAIADLEADFAEHLDVTEGPDGLYQDLQNTAPRVSRTVSRLRAEHAGLQTELDALRDLVASQIGSAVQASSIRRSATHLLDILARHRKRGTELVWSVYSLDVGGES